MNETKLATLLLQAFGYVNATEADVIPLESTGSGYCLTYILVEFHQRHIQFRRTEYSDSTNWEMMEVE